MQEESSDKMRKMKWWKIAVSAVGALLVIGATAYFLITRYINTSSVSLDNSVAPEIGYSNCGYDLSTLGINDLLWAQELNTKFIDHDLVFLIMPEDDSNSTETLYNKLARAKILIEAKGTRVETITLSPDDAELSITLKRFAIGGLPAVVAIASTGRAAFIMGNISQEALMRIYLVTTQAICGPGSSPGCCEGK